MRLILTWIMSLLPLFSWVWDGQVRFTVLEKNADQIGIRSFDPISLQGTEMIIPPDLNIESLGGRGVWPAKNIFKAGETQWAADSIVDYLGLGYTGFWPNLSIWDKINWWKYQDKIIWTRLDLTRGSLTKTTTMPDGQVVLQLTHVWFDQAKPWFASQTISDQHLSLAIINTTQALGLGSHAADIAESMGFKVDSVLDDTHALQKCRLNAPAAQLKSSAVKFLARTFGCDIEMGSDEQLKLWLGQDYQAKIRG